MRKLCWLKVKLRIMGVLVSLELGVDRNSAGRTSFRALSIFAMNLILVGSAMQGDTSTTSQLSRVNSRLLSSRSLTKEFGVAVPPMNVSTYFDI
jgi:hypothetical protein